MTTRWRQRAKMVKTESTIIRLYYISIDAKFQTDIGNNNEKIIEKIFWPPGGINEQKQLKMYFVQYDIIHRQIGHYRTA